MARVLSIYFQRLAARQRERDGLTPLLKWAYTFSPHIALDRAPLRTYKNDPRFCGLHLDVSGSRRLFGSEQALLARMRFELKAQGIQARLCVAPTLGAAWAHSRYSQEETLSIQEAMLIDSLKPLPLEALRLEEKSIAALKELNIKKIAQLTAIPIPQLRNRFPQEVVLRLQQAVGALQEPLHTLTFNPHIARSCSLTKDGTGAVSSQEVIKEQCRNLLKAILKECKAQQILIVQLVIRFSFLSAPTLSRSCSTTLPSDEYTHLWKLLQQLIETSPLEFGVQELSLSCPFTEAARPRHATFLGNTEETDVEKGQSVERDQSREYAKLLDSLYQRLGRKRVLQLCVQESHIPERSFYFSSWQSASRQSGSQNNNGKLVCTQRPSVLYPQAQAIRAMAVLPDTPPFWLRYKGKRHSISNSTGPERISPEWWEADAGSCNTRDYFRVQLEDGLWLWIYRDVETNKWFLHGAWL